MQRDLSLGGKTFTSYNIRMSTAAPFRDDGHHCNSCGSIAYISGTTARHCPQCGVRYEQEQNVLSVELKEIRVRPKTSEHDIQFKVKKAIGFLQNDHKVQIAILFRGREMAQIEEGREVMQDILGQLAEYGKVISEPSQQARRLICTIEPKQ